ncbi:PREDICTED: uncharacterized protein LOC105577230 isoform X2 [Cercocebus atys]|nr:PREDICTED: uncharacterized protein LOC105577230 isoform X2 [Cercocebus atys]
MGSPWGKDLSSPAHLLLGLGIPGMKVAPLWPGPCRPTSAPSPLLLGLTRSLQKVGKWGRLEHSLDSRRCTSAGWPRLFPTWSGAAGPCRVQIVPVLLGGVTLTPALAAPPAQLLSVLSVPEPPINGTRVLVPGCGCLCSTRCLRATQAPDLPTRRHTPGPHGPEHTPCPTLLRAAVRAPGATCWRTAASRLSPSGTFHSATPASGLAADGLGWAGKHPLSGSLGPQTLLQAPGAGRGQVQSEESCLPEVDRAGQTWRRHGGCSPGPTAQLSLCISGAGKIQGGPQGPEAVPSTPFLLVFRRSDALDTRGEVTPSRKLGLVSVPPQPQGLARTPGAPHPGDSAHRGLGRGLPRRLGSWVPHPLDFHPDIISSQVCLHLLITALGPPSQLLCPRPHSRCPWPTFYVAH